MIQIGECRVCHKNCLWIPLIDGILAAFDVCSYECLAKCKEAQEALKDVLQIQDSSEEQS